MLAVITRTCTLSVEGRVTGNLLLVRSVVTRGEALLTCLQVLWWLNCVLAVTGSQGSRRPLGLFWVSPNLFLYKVIFWIHIIFSSVQWGMLWMPLNLTGMDLNCRQYWRPKENMFILELLKLSNLNKLSELESNNYTFISPIQLPL